MYYSVPFYASVATLWDDVDSLFDRLSIELLALVDNGRSFQALDDLFNNADLVYAQIVRQQQLQIEAQLGTVGEQVKENRAYVLGNQTRAKVKSMFRRGLSAGQSPAQFKRKLLAYMGKRRKVAHIVARNATSLTHSYQVLTLAQSDPTVIGIDWVLAVVHEDIDVCDDLATIDQEGRRIALPYLPHECPIPVQDSHPLCLCSLNVVRQGVY